MSEAMDTENRNSYKQSLKATSLFGGVQIFNILIQIIRSIMKLFILFSCITAIVLTCKILMFGWSGYAVVTVFLVLTTYYSYTGLDRRIGIRQVIINKLHRKN